MAKTFTPQELDLAGDTVKISLANAAESLAKMLKEKVQIENFSLDLTPEARIPFNTSAANAPHIILTTDVIGDISAHTFLILDENASSKICQILLPATLLGSTEMREAMLMEIDNILAASAVTKFADILHRKITGHVPTLNRVTGPPKNFVSDKLNDAVIEFSYKADFFAPKTGIRAEFVCYFTEAFKESVKDRADKAETLDRVKENKSGFQEVLSGLKTFIGRLID